MKKIIYKQFGKANVLEIAEVEIPATDGKGIMVKVKAVSINPLDWKIFNGEMKLMSGSKFPKGLGIDFSGTVENVGTAVSNFKKGDEVFGLLDAFKGDALSEYILVSENALALKPKQISFEQAAGLPVAGVSALQILRKLDLMTSNMDILINGASGGIGMILTQVAKRKGLRVTAVTNTAGMALSKKWGSDTVIDYKKQDIFSLNKKYDAVIDLSGKLSFAAAKALLKESSTFVSTIPGPKEIITSFFNNLFSHKKYKILFLKASSGDLKELAQLAEKNLDIVVSRSYPLTAVVQAYQEVAQGGMPGKAVIKVS